jgi:hypothetical protein
LAAGQRGEILRKPERRKLEDSSPTAFGKADVIVELAAVMPPFPKTMVDRETIKASPPSFLLLIDREELRYLTQPRARQQL